MPVILNKSELATSELRKNTLEILEAGLGAVDTEKILKNKLSVKDGFLFINNDSDVYKAELPSPNLGEVLGGEVYFIGIGKCALDGAKVIEKILGDKLTGGIALDVRDPNGADLKIIKYRQGTHPYPSEQNISATKEVLDMTSELTEKDLVICLISGGGSSLFELPTISLEELIEKTKEMTARGADIYELNNFRKSVSQVKGGKFAEHCFPAKVVSLIFSDVLGNDIGVVASGPTAVANQFVQNILFCSNHDALIAMKNKAQELGFDTAIETETLSGNAAEIGKKLATREPKPKSCILFGGETTVILPASAPAEFRRGEGGRNQELVLSALLNIKKDSLVASVASDGYDNTEHAGAIADAELLEKAKRMNLSPEEFLERNDSYNFFKKLNDGAIYTGKLGSNVSDLVIMIYK